MAAYTSIGYSVADIAALKAIPPTDRPAFAGALVSVVSTNQWFEFDPSGTTGGVTPDTGSGRWYAMSREVLNANRTYFVRTDGNDNNTGLANTAGGAFATWTKAQDVLASLDGNGFTATVRFTGTFSPFTVDKIFVGFSSIQLEGDVTNPSNATIGGAGGIIFSSSSATSFFVRGFRINNTSGVGLGIFNGTVTLNGNMEFASGGFAHIYVDGQKAQLNIRSNYSITGSASTHICAVAQGVVDQNTPTPLTITIVGTPNFSLAFIFVSRMATMILFSTSYSGSATGKRYTVEALSLLTTNGTVSIPGNIAGTVDPLGFFN